MIIGSHVRDMSRVKILKRALGSSLREIMFDLTPLHLLLEYIDNDTHLIRHYLLLVVCVCAVVSKASKRAAIALFA